MTNLSKTIAKLIDLVRALISQAYEAGKADGRAEMEKELKDSKE